MTQDSLGNPPRNTAVAVQDGNDLYVLDVSLEQLRARHEGDLITCVINRVLIYPPRTKGDRSGS